jgi:hypothetical protein
MAAPPVFFSHVFDLPSARARKVPGWPKICKLARDSCGNTNSHKRLKLAQLLGQLGVFLAPQARVFEARNLMCIKSVHLI